MMASSEITVRRARADDAAATRDILYETYASTWRPELTAAARQVFQAEDRPAAYVSARGLQFWVAEQNGEVVAFVDWEGDFVNALHVRPGHARKGIGSRLMDAAEAQIVNAGFAAAWLETDTFNTRSQAFYAARGYLEADRYPDTEWNSGLTTILLVKAFD